MTNFDFDLKLNEQEYKQRSPAVFEEDLKMFGNYKNRLAIHSLDIHSKKNKSSNSILTDIGFLIVAQPHPECSFEWVRLIVDVGNLLSPVIQDLLPRTEKGDEPVKYTISDEKGISFEATSIKLGPKFTRKQEAEHTIYFEKIIASGKGSSKGLWDFYQQPHTKLFLENIVKLKITHEPMESIPAPSFLVETKLKIKGWKGLIPVIGTKTFSMQ